MLLQEIVESSIFRVFQIMMECPEKCSVYQGGASLEKES